jgi:hypothetical protein
MSVVTGAGLSGTNALKTTISNGGNADWHVQVQQAGLNIVSEKTYTIRFSAKSDSNKPISLALQQTISPYTVYSSQNVAITPTATTYTFTYLSTVNDATAALNFNIGGNTITVYLDNISVQ